MKAVAKYNLFKSVSTVLTVGTPITTLCLCSDLFVHRADTAVSAAGVFAILLSLLFVKDKVAERLKMPSAFVISTIMLGLLVLIESIIVPIKYVSLATMIATGIDELTFKRLYKRVEAKFPDKYEVNKIAGFMFTTTRSLMGDSDDE